MDFINTLLDKFSTNDFLEGGIILTAIGSLLYGLKYMLFWVLGRIDRMIRYTVTIESTNWNMYEAFSTWYYAKYPHKYRSLEYRLDEDNTDGKINFSLKLYPYQDLNIIRYAGRFIVIKMTRERIENANTAYDAYLRKYYITGIFAKKEISKLMNDVTKFYEDSHNNKTGVKIKSIMSGEEIVKYVNTYKTMDQIFFTGKKQLLEKIDKFVSLGNRYKELGIKYKLGIFLPGPPGTGKSSFGLALSVYLKRPIQYINLNYYTSVSQFIYQLSNAVNGTIFVFEDIDKMLPNDKSKKKPVIDMSTLLNSIDGMYSPEDVIFIMTTNHKDKIDPSLYRTGRFDIIHEMGYCDNETVNEYLSYFYNDNIKINGDVKNNLAVSDLQALCMLHDNPQKVINSITETNGMLVY